MIALLLLLMSPTAAPSHAVAQSTGRATLVDVAPGPNPKIAEEIAQESKELIAARRGINGRLDGGEQMSPADVEGVQQLFGRALKVWTRCLIIHVDVSARSTPHTQVIAAAEKACEGFRADFVEWLRTTVRAMGEQPSASTISQAMQQWDELERKGMTDRLNRMRQ